MSITKKRISKMTRNELKQMWLSIPHYKKTTTKTILVELGKNPHWKGYGEVTITSDGPSGYSRFKTHEKNPTQYALDTEEYKSGEYKLVIK